MSKRSLWIVLFSGMVAVGCGGGTGGNMGEADMSVAPPDMTVLPDLTVRPDLTVLLNCSKVITCIAACKDVACQQGCLDQASESATMKLTALQVCGLMFCTKADDAGVKPCSGPTDVSMGCQQCVADAVTGGSCAAELDACIKDK